MVMTAPSGFGDAFRSFAKLFLGAGVGQADRARKIERLLAPCAGVMPAPAGCTAAHEAGMPANSRTEIVEMILAWLAAEA
jgi:hypothetical protein